MLIFLTTLLASLASIFRSRASLGLENLSLRHQIGVLHRSAGKRPKLTAGDRLLWICLSRLWRDWRSALAIVRPETVVAWHRAAFRLFWTWKGRCGKPGRPVISSEVRDLIRKMCRENPGWGAPRIHGELLKLGIDIGEEPLCTCTGISQEFLLDMPKVYRVYIHTTLECSSPLIRPMRARSISKLLTGLRS